MPVPLVERLLEWLLQLHESSSIPFFVASLLTLAVQIPFATFYLLDFLWTWILVIYYQSSVLVLNGSLTSVSRKTPCLKVCRFLPLTTIPRTRAFQSLPLQDLVEEWQNLVSKSRAKHVRKDLDDEALLALLQTNQRARQLASYIVDKVVFPAGPSSISVDVNVDPKSIAPLLQQLCRIWFRAAELPPQTSVSQPSSATQICICDISLIIPVYKESWEKIQSLLNVACDSAVYPNKIQVILVDAGGNLGLDIMPNPVNTVPLSDHLEKKRHEKLLKLLFESSHGSSTNSTNSVDSHCWGDSTIVSYTGTGGRGGCMNHGAKQARGRILTFLHADTHLPRQWDRLILSSLEEKSSDTSHERRTNLVAFSMGIQMPPNASPAGLWGAGNFLGYIRCSVAHLPYGDSALSIPADVFNYIGGYPQDQALMEDFEIVRLLRKRWLWLSLARMLRRWTHHPNTSLLFSNGERMVVVKEQIACSPRRWEQYGVPYVTLCNAYCIFLYSQRNITANDLFDFYYRIRQATNKAKTS